jgi:hypothetical protein
MTRRETMDLLGLGYDKFKILLAEGVIPPPIELGPLAAVKKDKAKALDMFDKGDGGFADRDLYVFCANASDGIVTAHPNAHLRGQLLEDIEGKHGAAFGKVIVQNATEGTIKETTYWWPRSGSGSDKPLEKTTFYTKAGDQICGVGYYKE